MDGKPPLPEGLVAFVSSECPTCNMLIPVLGALTDAPANVTVVSQDDPSFPPGVEHIDDDDLSLSYAASVETVPTLLDIRNGHIRRVAVGWLRQQWEALTGVTGLGPGLPDHRPGCGSRSTEPGSFERLIDRFGYPGLAARQTELADLDDEAEACFAAGWTDGLPVVPPTPSRVYRMLQGTSRRADEILGDVPPALTPVTVEKVAINAVMAGCDPAYMPVVIAAVEAALTEEFHLHGVVTTTHPAGPVVVVNGPIARKIGMNSGINALGQGNRANASIGRALQLVVRNVGGGRPGEADRAALGNPGKFTFCFAEAEEQSPWVPLSVERGLPPGVDAVTLFSGEGPRLVRDETSRTPESLARSFAACLRTNSHPKQGYVAPTGFGRLSSNETNFCGWPFDALMVVSPDHARTFRQAGWSKETLRSFIMRELTIPGAEMIRGAGGIEEGLPVAFADELIPKFRPEGLNFVHAGGPAGLFSAIIGGRLCAPAGTDVVTREVRP
ncbi:MAG: thioredoxin family protein [bacterium]|jgi:hypothetical protein|nr:thioredoxin family protein [bacterium]